MKQTRARWFVGRAAGAVVAVVVVLGAAGSGSAGSSTSSAPGQVETGPRVVRITKDLEAIDEACRVAAGPDALRAAHDLGGLIAAGPEDVYGPPSAHETLADLGRVAARKAPCAHTPALRRALRSLGS